MLRSLRLGAGLTADEVALRLGFSRSKVSRLENGRRGASDVDIRQLCELYQVDDEHRLRLSELAAEGRQRMERPPFSLPHSDYIELEAEAEAISDYGLAIVPGLLQTPEYARAIVSTGVPAQQQRIVDERVQTRMARQQRLCVEEAPAFEAILDESVLHRVVGNPDIMVGQLRRLLEMSQLPNVTIRVVPYDVGIVPAGVNKFIILHFELPDVPDVVLIEDLTDHHYLEEPHEVGTYKSIFQILTTIALDSMATRDIILSRLAAFGSGIR